MASDALRATRNRKTTVFLSCARLRLGNPPDGVIPRLVLAIGWAFSLFNCPVIFRFQNSKPSLSIFHKLSQQSLLEFHNSPQNGNTDIYWISSSIIEELRLQADFKNKNNKLLFE